MACLREYRCPKSLKILLNRDVKIPSDVYLDVFDVTTMSKWFSKSPSNSSLAQITRRNYARICVFDIGIPTPGIASGEQLHITEAPEAKTVPFILKLEPLCYGLLPTSVVPVLGFLALVIAFSSLGVPVINSCLQRIADQARRELRGHIEKLE